jgi:DnaJ-class molecular chaperone
MAKQDYYQTLNVKRDASEKEIKQAYRRLARQYHPDVNPGDAAAEQKFKEISEAYEVLGNAESRTKYDRFGHQAFDTSGGGFGGFHTGNIRDIFGSGGGFTEGFGIIFDDLFAGGGGRTEPMPQRGQDVEQTLEIPFEDALRGTTTRVKLTHRDGSVERRQIKIPPGVDTSSKIRITGKGAAGTTGGPAGDLYVVIRVKPHAYFERRGNDIECEVPVTLAEAMLGAKIEVPTIDGPTSMTLPPGTQNGRRFRLRGKGAPNRQGNERGNQYVRVHVVLPETLDDRSRELLEEFSARNPMQPRAKRW